MLPTHCDRDRPLATLCGGARCSESNDRDDGQKSYEGKSGKGGGTAGAVRHRVSFVVVGCV